STKHISNEISTTNDMLYEYKWYVAELDGKPYTFVGQNNETSWLKFNEGSPVKVSGYTGCNNLMGSVEIKDKDLMKFSPLATTKMFCSGNTESNLLNAFASVTNYNIADTQLLLSNGNIVVAKLNGVSPEVDKLSGIWGLNYISGPKITFNGLYPDKKPIITFNFSAKEMMGNTSCNGFSSKFTIDGNKIQFSDALKTMVYCEGGGEETFLSMLKKVNRYSVNDTTLTFMMDDIAIMRFAKQTIETINK
ncbi:MAG TPA: META domain-containing protein, partial [Hanamia sp.]|nr:META domain-containing protein [Hanamia sp.]